MADSAQTPKPSDPKEGTVTKEGNRDLADNAPLRAPDTTVIRNPNAGSDVPKGNEAPGPQNG